MGSRFHLTVFSIEISQQKETTPTGSCETQSSQLCPINLTSFDHHHGSASSLIVVTLLILDGVNVFNDACFLWPQDVTNRISPFAIVFDLLAPRPPIDTILDIIGQIDLQSLE